MAIDTQTLASIGDIGFDPAGAQGKALSIKDMMDREQLSKLQVGKAKEDSATNTKVQTLLKGESVDYSNPEGVMRTAEKINKISPSAAMEFQTHAQKYSSGQVQAQVDQYELLDHQQGLIVNAIDPIVAEARAMKQKGADDLTVNAFIMQQVPGALQSLKDTKLPNGQSALSPEVADQVNKGGNLTLAALEGFEQKSKQGQAAIKARLEQIKSDTAVKKEDETERHDRENERLGVGRLGQGQEKIDAQREKLKSQGFTDHQSELLAAMADANVSLPAGLRSQSQIKATIDGLYAAHPDMTAAEITEGIKSGKLKLTAESSAARTAGTQVGKVTLATNEIEPFGRQVLEASKNLPKGRDYDLTLNGILQAKDKDLQDPNLLVLKAKLQALNNAYDQLAARGGTDKDKRAHVHDLFDSRLNDQNIQALVKAVTEEGQGAKEAADKTIGEVSGTGNVPGITGKTKAPAGPPAPFSDAQKEERYQEWKAAHPNG